MCIRDSYKQVYRELIRAMHPNVSWPVRIGNDPVPQNILFAVLAFAFMYMASIVSMTLLMSFSGLDTVTAVSAVVASINNTGPVSYTHLYRGGFKQRLPGATG